MSLNPSKPQLKLDWCSYEAAKYACEHWHYSKCLPAGKSVKIGVWENSEFVGCIIFSRGANNNLLKPYNLEQIEGCELTRIALTSHGTPVSKMMAIAIKMLKKQSPGMRLIISYADPVQDHHGGIYQATNWVYSGKSDSQTVVLHKGKYIHARSAHSLYGSIIGHKTTQVPGKHRYLYPLDEEMRQRILPRAKPYPKKPCATSIEGDATSNPTGRGGFNTTVALLERIEVVS